MSDWLSFRGVNSTSLGVYMLDPPPITIAAERVLTEQIPGRDGDLEITDGALDPISLPVLLYCRDESRINEIAAWLRGRGWLQLGNRPNERYKARCVTQIQLDRIVRGRDNRTFEVLFDCQPHRYIYPEADDIEIMASGATVTNPGTAKSEPKLRIEGTGDFWVAIGTQLMDFDGVLDGVVVDSEQKDVLDLTETGFLNSVATMDESPTLAPGANIITWSGDVTKITVTPRWRNI